MKNPFWYPITLLKISLFFFLTLFSRQSFSQSGSKIFFYSKTEKTPLGYLKIQEKDGKASFFTDIKGKLDYDKNILSTKSEFIISGYGVNDTLISAKHFLEADTIFLKVKEFVLPELTINSSKLKEIKIGDWTATVDDVSNPIRLFGGQDGEAYRYTVKIQMPKGRLLLDQLKFHVSAGLNDQVDLVFRVLYSPSLRRISHGKNYPISDFNDLLPSPMIINVHKSGWKKIEFSEPVFIPSGTENLFLVFDILENSYLSNFSISEQSTTKKIDLGFYITGGKLGVFEPFHIHPAIELVLLKD